MAANEASRLSSTGERSSERPAAEGTPIAKVRQVPSEPGVMREQTGEARAPSSEHNLDDLERAAEGIRPSWHGTEIELRSPTGELPQVAGIPAPLPPPAPLPSFASFPIERAPLYSADSTVRTAALLPERLAHILNQPQLARMRQRASLPAAQAAHYLRTHPWALACLALGTLSLLASLLWPAPDATPSAAVAHRGEVATDAVHRAPPPPALPTPPSLVEPAAADHAAGPSAREAEQAAASEPPAVLPAAKKRDKRSALLARGTARLDARPPAKPLANKAREPKKANKPALPAR
jgi:hypothetical protein